MGYLQRRVEHFKKLKDNTWDSTATVLEDATGVTTREIVGKGKDGFEFRISNKRNRLHEMLFSGDGSTKVFTLLWAPPSTFLNTTSVRVFVDDVEQAYTTNYTISGITLTFGSAPSSSNENIKVRYSLLGAGDRIKIYWWKDSATHTNSDLQMEGTIETAGVGVTSKNIYTVRGYTLFEALMNGMAFMTPSAAVNNSYLAIIQVIASINRFYQATERKIYGETLTEWGLVTNPITGGGNPTTKQDGSAFPTREFSFDYKRGVDAIEELSDHEYTQDNQYLYWVKYNVNTSRYEFIWAPKTKTVSGTLNYGTGISNLVANRDIEPVANMLIYHCGTSPYGVPIRWFIIDTASSSGVGTRVKFVTKSTSHIAGDLITKEFENDSTKWEKDGDGNQKEKFPKDASYPYTFLFEARDSVGKQSGSKATAANDDDFNEVIVQEARALGKEICQHLLTLYKNPRIGATLTYSRDPITYALGEFWNVNAKPFGLYEKPLRIMQINHSFWKTQVFLEEDEDKITI